MKSVWEHLRYFKKDEQPFGFGDPDAIDTVLLRVIDNFRDYLGIPMIVRCGTQGEHVSNYHKEGLAVDLLIECKNLRPLDVLMAATRFPFSGIGVMPAAVYSKMKRPFGIHLDMRPIVGFMTTAYWISIPNPIKKNSRQVILQYSLNEENMRRFGMLV